MLLQFPLQIRKVSVIMLSCVLYKDNRNYQKKHIQMSSTSPKPHQHYLPLLLLQLLQTPATIK